MGLINVFSVFIFLVFLGIELVYMYFDFFFIIELLRNIKCVFKYRYFIVFLFKILVRLVINLFSISVFY